MNIYLLFVIFTTTSSEVKAQGVPDTLAYLQSIVLNKANYIGQPFSVLQNHLQIEIKFFSPFGAIPHDKYKETSTSLGFYFPETAEEVYLTYPSLEIYWRPYLNAKQSGLLYSQYNVGGWSVEVANFYANGIISDIKIQN